MKAVIGALALAGAMTAAGSAAAQESVTLFGTSEPYCTLPDTWAYVSATGGAGSSQFSGHTWTIPEGQFADANSNAVASGEIAIRIRGTGSCNTSHTIRIQSERGGLRTGDVSQPAPAGFANGRPMQYEANWWGNSGQNAYGPKATLNATTPGQQSNLAAFNVSGALPAPANRGFDIRMGMARGALAQPLMAGTYSDAITVTIALAP